MTQLYPTVTVVCVHPNIEMTQLDKDFRAPPTPTPTSRRRACPLVQRGPLGSSIQTPGNDISRDGMSVSASLASISCRVFTYVDYRVASLQSAVTFGRWIGRCSSKLIDWLMLAWDVVVSGFSSVKTFCRPSIIDVVRVGRKQRCKDIESGSLRNLLYYHKFYLSFIRTIHSLHIRTIWSPSRWYTICKP